MSRIVNFFDGAQSETTPTIGNIVASSLVQYSDDATYEANEQGAPAEGNVYFNTTLNLIRYYNGTAWISLVDETSSQTIQNKTIDGSSTGNNDVKTIASKVEVTPAGNLSSTDAQDALEELQSDIDALDTRLDTAEADIVDLQNDKENKSEKGQPNGYASLDGTGKVPAAQLPSYVDDVEEYANLASFPVTGETGKIYTAIDTNKIYRWTGSIYVEISSSGTFNLNDLTDVNAPTPADNDVLTWDSGTSSWINQAPGGAPALNDLTDVNTTGALTGQYLRYDGTEWRAFSDYKRIANVSASPYNVQNSDDVILVDSTVGAITINLPTAVGITGKIFYIKKTSNDLNLITIDGNASETIEGSLTRRLRMQGDWVRIISNGSNFAVVEKGYDETIKLFTPTGTFTTNTTYEAGYYRTSWQTARVALSIKFPTGAPNAVTLTNLTVLPAGLTFDTANYIGRLGNARCVDFGVNFYEGFLLNLTSTTFQPVVVNSAGTYAGISAITNTVPFSFNTGDSIEIELEIPVTEWAF